jgi:hypothetical protein
MNAEAGSWKPIADAPLAARLRSIVDTICDRIAERAPQWMKRARYPAPVTYWLPQGFPGLSLLFSYRAASGGGAEDLRHADAFEAEALEGLANETMVGALFDGFLGIAWAAAHRRGFLAGGAADEEDFDDVSSRVAEALARPRWSGHYDLAFGLAGIGIYFLENPQWAVTAQALPDILRHLDANAERSGELVTWFTPPSLLSPYQLKSAPLGFYNAGMAHGLPGVIGFLARARPLAGGRADELLTGAVEWLLAQETDREPLRYPTWVTPDGNRPIPRLAWCYGDLGITCALFRAAASMNNAEWRRRALAAAEKCLGHPDLPTMDDVCVCHGLAGIVHAFNRIYQATGDDRFRVAAIGALTRIADLWDPEGESWTGFPIPAQFGRDVPSVLEGAAGVALVLLAATNAQLPEWDRLFLMDLPVASP